MEETIRKMVKHVGTLSLLIFILLSGTGEIFISGLDNGLAKTPPMGWISWVRFECNTNCSIDKNNCISYELYSRMGKSMKEKGFVDLGYRYVNIDDCWSEMERHHETKRLIPHKERFKGEDGMKKLSAELGAMGIKLGIYGDCGIQTCAKYPAQLSQFDSDVDNYFEIDAETFYSWGIESFKFDNCNISPNKSEQICPGMTRALMRAGGNGTHNPILLTCEWPVYMMSPHHIDQSLKVDWELLKQSCNMWRHFDDIYDAWASIENIVDYSISIQNEILIHHGPGGWFDPDQLIVGGYGLSHDQARVHMAMWSLWSAPLFMSNDIAKLEPRDIELLQNKHLIKVNQDPLGIWAQMVLQDGQQVWSIGIMQVFVKPIKSDKHPSLVANKLFCPDFVIGYLYRGALGNSVKFAIPIRKILNASKHVIEEASKRLTHTEWAAKCLDRINSKTKENAIKEFLVEDLMDSSPDFQHNLNITGNLKLEVNPTGIRVVKLTERLDG